MKSPGRMVWKGAFPMLGLILLLSCAQEEEVDRGRPTREIVLTKEAPSARASDTLVAPGRGYQKYTLYRIDTREFGTGGKLIVTLSLGSEGCNGSFDLFPEGASIPEEGRPTTSVAHLYDVGAGGGGSMDYRFTQGQVFQFGATGNWFSAAGATNTYSFTATVTDFQ